MSSPRISCIAIIARNNAPLHIHPFPTISPTSPTSQPPPPTTQTSALTYNFLAHATLDVFHSRLPLKSNGDSDFGHLYSINEEQAAYGWLTNTGVRFVVVVDSGAAATTGGGGGGAGTGGGRLGIGDGGDLRGVFRALQTAYIQLVCNPFYEEGGLITSPKFIEEVRRIGEGWGDGTGGGL